MSEQKNWNTFPLVEGGGWKLRPEWKTWREGLKVGDRVSMQFRHGVTSTTIERVTPMGHILVLANGYRMCAVALREYGNRRLTSPYLMPYIEAEPGSGWEREQRIKRLANLAWNEISNEKLAAVMVALDEVV